MNKTAEKRIEKKATRIDMKWQIKEIQRVYTNTYNETTNIALSLSWRFFLRTSIMWNGRWLLFSCAIDQNVTWIHTNTSNQSRNNTRAIFNLLTTATGWNMCNQQKMYGYKKLEPIIHKIQWIIASSWDEYAPMARLTVRLIRREIRSWRDNQAIDWHSCAVIAAV